MPILTSKGAEGKNRFQKRANLLLIPSLAGVLVFYIIPYIRMLYYSVIESQFERRLVGLKHYASMMKNTYFRLAMKNTLVFMGIWVPVVVLLGLILSVLLVFLGVNSGKLRMGFIFPILIPTAGIALVWRLLFEEVDSAMPIYLLFVWKNIGFGIILFMASFTSISTEFYEAAMLDGANFFQMHRKITIPLIAPTIVFVTLLQIVNSFKIFKESFIFYGTNYPPDYSYSLQFYMNNHFLKLNYQNLAASAVFISFFIMILIGAGMKLQKRFES